MIEASTVINQMGGIGKLKAMIGASEFIKSASYLMFSFKGSRKTNKIMIALKNDTYQITFYKWQKSKMELKTVQEYSDVYAENLKEIFESFTGLYLSL